MIPRSIAKNEILDRFKQVQTENVVRAVKQRCAIIKRGDVALPSLLRKLENKHKAAEIQRRYKSLQASRQSRRTYPGKDYEEEVEAVTSGDRTKSKKSSFNVAGSSTFDAGAAQQNNWMSPPKSRGSEDPNNKYRGKRRFVMSPEGMVPNAGAPR